MPITIGVALRFPKISAQSTSKMIPTARQARTRCGVDIVVVIFILLLGQWLVKRKCGVFFVYLPEALQSLESNKQYPTPVW